MRLVLCLSLFVSSAAAGEDWPQWRGPNRDGHVIGFTPPANWPAVLKKRWEVTVGLGHSGPVVAGDRAFQFSREGESEVVRAIRLADGKTLWSQSCLAPFVMSPWGGSHGKGPKATPVLSGGRLVMMGIANTLYCCT
jgi:outer membrane protein assembly factor BamB